MSKAEQLAAALDDFLAVSNEVEAAAIVSADGLPMASALPPHVEEDRLAAMSAALLTLGERAATGLGKGELAQVFVEGVSGYVVLMSAGHNAVLVAVTDKGAKVGLVLFEMRRIAARVAAVMESDASASPVSDEATPVTNVIEESVSAPAAATLAPEPAPSYTPPPSFEPEPAATEWDAVPAGEPTVTTWEPAPEPVPAETVEPQQAPSLVEQASSVSEWDVPPAPATSEWDTVTSPDSGQADGSEERAKSNEWDVAPAGSEEAESPVSGWQ